MARHQYYRLNQPAVIAEVVDQEAVIVNLDSGAYYSLRDLGGLVWELLVQRQMPLPAVLATLGTHYAGSASEISDGVEQLLAELLAEHLILPLEQAPVAGAAPAPLTAPATRLPYQPPKLEKFTDMADLLLLDPIHEVSEAGWPHTGQPPASASGSTKT